MHYHRGVQPERAGGSDPNHGRLLDILGYDELRAIAGRIARSGRLPEHDATSLLHEALENWMRRRASTTGNDRDALMAAMVTTIRNASIDRARRRQKGSAPVTVDPEVLDQAPGEAREPLDRETLEQLAASVDELRARAPRAAAALELRIHGGLSLEEVADALAVSLAQAKRDIAMARAFVRARIDPEGHAP